MTGPHDQWAIEHEVPRQSPVAVGPLSLMIRFLGLDESSLYGEVLALAAVALVTLMTLGGSHFVFSDYLQSGRLIGDVCTGSLAPSFWSHKPVRAAFLIAQPQRRGSL